MLSSQGVRGPVWYGRLGGRVTALHVIKNSFDLQAVLRLSIAERFTIKPHIRIRAIANISVGGLQRLRQHAAQERMKLAGS